MKLIKEVLLNHNYTKANKALYKGDMNEYEKYQRRIYHSIWSKYIES